MEAKKIPPSPPVAKRGGEDDPYPGLRPYREDEQGKFFGREADKAILVDKVLGNRLTLLFAASGVGKSSLLNAAVIPHLKADSGENLSVVYVSNWLIDPLNNIPEQIVKVLRECDKIPTDFRIDKCNSLVEFLDCCGLFVRSPLVLIFDQFEEFFRYHRNTKSYRKFLEQLAEVVTSDSIHVSLVLSMREDFALELNALKVFLPVALFENFYRLEKLDMDKAKRAIVMPAQQFEYSYANDLLDRLLLDLANQYLVSKPTLNNVLVMDSIELPYLQIVCSFLWKTKSNTGKIIGLQQYLDAGGAGLILHRHLDNVLNSFESAEKYIVDRILSCLVNYPGFKVAYTNEGLSSTIGIDLAQVDSVLGKLERTQIIRKQNNKNELWYELSHDMYSQIIREWQYAWRDSFDCSIAFDALLQKRAFKRISFGGLRGFLNGIGDFFKKIRFLRFRSVNKSVNSVNFILTKQGRRVHEDVSCGKKDVVFLDKCIGKIKLHLFRFFDEVYGVYYFLGLLILLSYVVIFYLFVG